MSFDSRFVCRCTGQAEVFDLKTDQFQVQQSPEMHFLALSVSVSVFVFVFVSALCMASSTRNNAGCRW